MCVCTIHPNVKLMLAATQIDCDYKSLMAKTVCSLESKDCMLHRCDTCPGEEALEEFLLSAVGDFDPEETISFKQWVHTDREALITKQLPIEEFVSELSTAIWNLSCHHFIAKHQSNHLKSLKENLSPSEIVVLMDFAENYSFIVQDASQGFHWENSQATVHPFAIYYKGNGDNVECLSICAISDSLVHDTVVVHAFLTQAISIIKGKVPNVKHVHYFSDGSAAQYKNFKNIMNLCCHLEDYGLTAEWNFFATSHGKSPCDGIGGTVKRLAAHSCLQHPLQGQILTPDDLYSFCRDNISGVISVFVSKEEIEMVRKSQDTRFEHGSTIAGTRENHQFIPIDQQSVQVSRISGDIPFIASLGSKPLALEPLDLQPGKYVACIYEQQWWIGNITENSVEEKDSLITFLHPHGPSKSFQWPLRSDICWIPWEHVLCIIVAPTTTATGRSYSIPSKTMSEIDSKFKKMVRQLRIH